MQTNTTTQSVSATRRFAALELRTRALVHVERRSYRAAWRATEAAKRLDPATARSLTRSAA